MNDQQENRLSRNEKITSFLDKHKDELNATPAIGAALLPQLIALNQKMRSDDEHAVQDNTGYADSKEDTEEKLENMTDHVGSGLESYADDADDFVLMNSVEFTLSQIQAFRDNRLLQYAQFVYGKATDKNIQPVLTADHNISVEDIETLGKLIGNYETALPLPQQTKGESVAWGKQVDRDLAEADKILVRIRRKMSTYRTTNILLFDGFQAVDSVDDTGSHKSKERTISAGKTESALTLSSFSASAPIGLQNTGSKALRFALYEKGKASGDPVTVNGGTSLSTTLGNLGSSGDELMVINDDAVTDGSYIINYQ